MNGLEAVDTIDKDFNYEFYDDNRYRLKTPIKVHDIFSEEIEVIRKELKALEIIKKKRVNVEQFMIILHDYKYRSLEEQARIYNSQCARWNVLSRDEFNLLKEVMK